jgi:hypothetical protein
MNEREVFDAALAIADPNERSSYLNRACGDDQPLRDHLCGLLEAHDPGNLARYNLAVSASRFGEGDRSRLWTSE